MRGDEHLGDHAFAIAICDQILEPLQEARRLLATLRSEPGEPGSS
jgi:hypothetical protein